MRFLRTARAAQPSQVMIFGAGSDMGAALVQLSKATGAEVTAVTHSAKLWAVAALGADSVLDFAKIGALDLSNSFEVLFDCTGTLSNRQARTLLANQGRFAVIGGGNGKSSRATRPADMRQIH
ncbi:MAG: zinc-binding dehydrogenase [Sphingopyxis sp.]|nr:zinc-binding dehydrogenase [Sphingopyxis sp.]